MEENQHISNLFQRIRMSIGKQMLDREAVTKIIFSETKVNIPADKIQYKNRTILLNISPLMRGEVYFKKTVILERIKKETGLEIKDLK